MARKPRIHYPGAFYHIILRGNAGQDVFFTKGDRHKFFFLLQEGVERYKHRIHAFCLMTNHIHLLVQVGEVALSRILQNVSFRYTRYINNKRGQQGHLFQGRYKAILIDAESYLLELVRYIHNNPVRAGMVRSPRQYQWSSHKVYIGDVFIPWLTTDEVLAQFADNRESAIQLYGEYVFQEGGGTHDKKYHSGTFEGRILGEEDFVEESLARASQMEAKKPGIDLIVSTVCGHLRIDEAELSGGSRRRKVSQGRAVLALIVREMRHISLMELSKKMNRDISGLSQAAGRLERAIKNDQKISGCLSAIKKKLA